LYADSEKPVIRSRIEGTRDFDVHTLGDAHAEHEVRNAHFFAEIVVILGMAHRVVPGAISVIYIRVGHRQGDIEPPLAQDVGGRKRSKLGKLPTYSGKTAKLRPGQV